MHGTIKEGARGTSECIDRKRGVFRIYFSMGKDPDTGKYLRSPYRRVHCKSKNPKNWPSEVSKALEAYRLELEGMEKEPDKPKRLYDYALSFHGDRKAVFGSIAAFDREELDVEHIGELFGNPLLSSLRPDDISAAYERARKSGRFSESEIRRIHIKLKQIMENAVDNDRITKNPCRHVKLPKVNYEARNALSSSEAARLLGCLREEAPSSFVTCTMLLLLCGMRKGEALGLSWERYDPSKKTLRIEKQYSSKYGLRDPKSKMSRREISIGGELASYLERWKRIQQEELLELGFSWNEQTPIVHSIGVLRGADEPSVNRMNDHNYSRAFRNFSVKHGFGSFETKRTSVDKEGEKHYIGTGYSGLKPHELRHTHATLLVGAKADIKTIQARLGHASPSTTLSIYSHFIPANDQKAAETFDSILEN